MRLAGGGRRALGPIASVSLALFAFWHGAHALESWRSWRRTRVSDPSAAELYLTNLQVETAFVVCALVGAFLVWRLTARDGG